MAKTNKLMSTMIASVLFIAMLMLPLYIANAQTTGELDSIGLGTATEIHSQVIDTNASIDAQFQANDFDGATDGQLQTACRVGASAQTHSNPITLGERGNLTGWGDNVASGTLSISTAYDTGRFDISGDGAVDACQFAMFVNVSKADMLSAEAFAFAVNSDFGNASYVAWSLQFGTFNSPIWSDVASAHAVLSGAMDGSWTVQAFDDGDIVLAPLTTQDHLLIQNKITDDADLTSGQRNMALFVWYIDDGDLDLMEDGDLVVIDAAFLDSRDGLLAGAGRLIAFNVAFALIGGLLVIVATPWVSFEDIFGRMGRGRSRKNQNGVDDGRSVLLWLGVAVVGLAAWMFFGGTSGGGISGFFTASLLPLSIAVVAIMVVALSTRGRSNRGMTVILASIAGVLGWVLGQSIQNNWLPYDELYVANFVNVASGGVALTDGFALSAFFVVTVQLLGIIIGLYNIATTITSDETVSAVQ